MIRHGQSQKGRHRIAGWAPACRYRGSVPDAGGADQYGPVLTTVQVAELLDLTPQTVQQMAKDGRLPAHRLPGARKYLFFTEDVLSFLRRHPVRPARPPPVKKRGRRP
jgi:excisionase family DNA binding protein